MSFWEGKNVVVTGGAGFLGSHLCDRLREKGVEPFVPRSKDYDLRQEKDIIDMLLQPQHYKGIDVLFHLAATCGGIGLNQEHPGLLFYENLMMGAQLIERARLANVGKFVCVGTVCSYPRAAYALREGVLWDGYPDPTNAPYGIAKRALLVQLQAYRHEYQMNGVYVLPTNLYGPGDNFDPDTSHVIPALIKKCLEAKESGADSVTIWGTGTPSRDFLYVEDCADALMLIAEEYDRPEPLNLGSEQEITVLNLLHFIKEATGFEGKTVRDSRRPDGQPRRVLDASRVRHVLGWRAETKLVDGLKRTVEWYRANRV